MVSPGKGTILQAVNHRLKAQLASGVLRHPAVSARKVAHRFDASALGQYKPVLGAGGHVDVFPRLDGQLNLALVGQHKAKNPFAIHDVADLTVGMGVDLVKLGQQGLQVGGFEG